jgi:hypothetical protein
MIDKINLERTVLEIPVKRIANLTKDIRKYDEHVNKCDISGTNILADSIGSDMDYLTYSVSTTDEQKQQLKRLEDEFSRYMGNLKKCICVKKIEK